MLQKINGFRNTVEAQAYERLIEQRQQGALLFAPAAVTPAVQHKLQAPKL